MFGYSKLVNDAGVGDSLFPGDNRTYGSTGYKDYSLIIDFDSRYGVGLSNGLVVSWKDRAKGIICRPPTVINRPTYNKNAYDNIPAVVCDGVNTWLSYAGRITELEGIDSFTIIMVSLGSTPGSNHYRSGGIHYQAVDDRTNKSLGCYNDVTTDTALLWFVENNNLAGTKNAKVDQGLSLSSICIYGWTYNGKVPTGADTLKHSLYNAPRTPNASFTGGMTRTTFKPLATDKCQFNIGCYSDGAGLTGSKHDGSFVRFQIYNREIPIDGGYYKKIVRDLINEYRLTNKRQIICLGDSRTHNSSHPTTLGWVAQTQAVLGESSFLMMNCGIGSDTIANAVTNETDRVITQLNTFSRQIFCIWYGRNDLVVGGATPATVFSNLKTYCQAIKTARADATVIIFTELPSAGGAGYETDRQTLNTSIRSEVSPPWDYICDIGNDATIGQAGQNLDATYYSNSDHIHPTFAGDTIISSVISPILAVL